MASVQEHIKSLNLRPPTAATEVFKDDCVYCFDTPESPYGLDVCLQCFQSSSPDPAHDYTALHYSLTRHAVFLNIRKTPKPRREDSPAKIAKLAIAADKEEDHFDTTTFVKDLEFGSDPLDTSIANLQEIVDAILAATSYSKKEEIQAWEQEILPCEHILYLEQEPPVKLSSEVLSHCAQCDLKENLWLCLVCGSLGCGRAQFGGVGGNGHGLAHYEQTGHIASVKLGSITPEGSADVYCYKCADEIQDSEITEHLRHWGIAIADRQKTEKSLVELQLEQNLKWDFKMTADDGTELEPVFGPELTGLKNLGNSCYISSALQCLFSLASFQTRFAPYQNPEVFETSHDPAHNLEVQLRKIADGLLSGRYSVPDTYSDADSKYQRGISLGMFKYLIGKGHEEFSTMRQQDSFEFLIFLLDKVSSLSKQAGYADPVNTFRFQTERRLECINCNAVRYKVENQENISIPVPARKVEGAEEVTYEPVKLQECFDVFTGKEHVEYRCKTCDSTSGAVSSTSFKTFPDVLVLNARRFQVIDWAPVKLDIPVIVPNEAISLDAYLSAPQPGENVVEDDDDEGAQQQFVPNEAAIAFLESTGFPRVRCEKALYNTGNQDPEQAMNWLLNHMEDPDIDEPLALGGSTSVDEGAISQLGDMGFTPAQAKLALKKTSGDVGAAVEWLFSHPDETGEEPEADQPAEPEVLGNATLPADYRLKAIICHKGGSVHAGHYVAFIQKPVQGSSDWVLFNDEKVVRGGEAEEMKKFAYVYFFERA